MIYLIIVIILLGGSAFVLVNDFALGINAITKRISIPWLRITLNILLKVLMLGFVIIGVMATAIVAIAFNSNSKQKD